MRLARQRQLRQLIHALTGPKYMFKRPIIYSKVGLIRAGTSWTCMGMLITAQGIPSRLAAAAEGDPSAAATPWQEWLPWLRRNAPAGSARSAMLPQSLLQPGGIQHTKPQAHASYRETLNLARALQPPQLTLVAALLNNQADVEAAPEHFAQARSLLEESLALKNNRTRPPSALGAQQRSPRRGGIIWQMRRHTAEGLRCPLERTAWKKLRSAMANRGSSAPISAP